MIFRVRFFLRFLNLCGKGTWECSHNSTLEASTGFISPIISILLWPGILDTCPPPCSGHVHHSTHLGLVPGLGFCPAAVGNVLILGLDLGNDTVQVQAAVVVHGEDHRGVRDVRVHLGQLLQGNRKSVI